jgi:MSHA biogenesis protein MshE
VRVICESCVIDYELLPAEREWLQLELGQGIDQHHYKHGRGCSHCNGTGYRGRTGVYELLEMTSSVAHAANNGDHTQFIKVAREQLAGETLRRHAVELVMAGRTTVSEAMRISNQLED